MRSRRIAGLLTCVLLSTAACSGAASPSPSSPSGSVDPGTPASPSSASSISAECGSEIAIGSPVPLTGVWAENGQNVLSGAELAAQEVNDAGGIKSLGGAKIKIYSADTSSDPPQAKIVTERLLGDHKLAALIGSYTSGLTLTSAIPAELAGVPILTQSFADALTEKGYKFLFQVPPKASGQGASQIDYLVEAFKAQGKELKGVAVVGSSDAGPKAQLEAAAKAATDKGLSVVLQSDFPSGLTDATAIVTKVSDAKPDLLIMFGALTDISLIVKTLRGQGNKTPIFGANLITAETPKLLGDLAEGALATDVWNYDLKLSGVPEAAAAYKAQHGTFMPQEAGEAWVAVHQVAYLMDQLTTCDPKKIRDGLASTEFTTGPASAMPGGRVAYDETGADKHAYILLVQWQGGELRTVAPASDAVAPMLPLP